MTDIVEITPVTTRRFGKDELQNQMSVGDRELLRNAKTITKTYTILAPLMFLSMLISGQADMIKIVKLLSQICHSFSC